jgi:thioredoxin-like negative regulator of GroEL
MLPVVNKTSEKFPEMSFGKMTIDDPACTDYADGFGITNVPTFVLMENGKVIDKKSGTMTESQLANFLDF